MIELQDAVTLAADLQEPVTAERLLGWIYHRSRSGLFQGRAARDAALSDINHATQKYGGDVTHVCTRTPSAAIRGNRSQQSPM